MFFLCYPITTSKKVKNGASVHEDVRKKFSINSDKEKKETLNIKEMSFHWPCFHGETQQQQYF